MIPKLKYLDHIDALRAVAVILVLLFHVDLTFFKGGFLGVDVFFVISGFLITRNITHEFKTTGKFNFVRFYYRRIKRLLPSFLLTSVLVFILGILLLSPSDFIQVTESIFMGSVALSNFYFLGESGYFDTAAKLKPMLHTWSLSIEEQYYFIWPLTLFLFLKLSGKIRTWVFTLALLVAGFAFTYYITANGVSDKLLSLLSHRDGEQVDVLSMVFFLLPFRTYEFLIGGILVFIPMANFKNGFIRITAIITGFLLILIPAMSFDESLKYLSLLNILPCLGVAILILVTPGKKFHGFYFNKTIRNIGNASYTIYLLHWPLIVFYKHLTNKPLEIVSGTVLFVMSIVISMIVYKYYESPFRFRKLKTKGLEYAKMGSMLILFIGSSFFVMDNVRNNDGWLWRLSNKNLALIEEIGVPVDFHLKNWGSAGYWYDAVLKSEDNPKNTFDLIFMGDSHTGHFAAGVDSVFVKKNHKNAYVSYLKCFLLPEVIPKGQQCTIDSDSLFRQKISTINNNPDAVLVISYYWHYRLFSAIEMVDSAGIHLEYDKSDKPHAYALLCKKIEKLRPLIGENRKIVIMGESPVRYEEISYIEKLMKPRYFSFISETKTSFKRDESQVEINAFMKEYFSGKENFYFIDPSEPFCEDGSCISQQGSTIYFSDKDHLSIQGSIRLFEHFEEEFMQIMERD